MEGSATCASDVIDRELVVIVIDYERFHFGSVVQIYRVTPYISYSLALRKISGRNEEKVTLSLKYALPRLVWFYD